LDDVDADVRFLEFVRRVYGYRFPRVGALSRHLFKRLPARFESELFPGVHVPVDTADEMQVVAWWQGERFEAPTPKVLGEWARGATHFFDGGANVGFYTYLMYAKNPDLEIHAFEANPVLAESLDAVCRANDMAKVEVHPLGLGDASGRFELHVSPLSGQSTFGVHPMGADFHTVTVPVSSFDDWRRASGLELPASPTWVLKLDVEGYEPRVLRGMEETLEAHAFKGIVVEVNPYTLRFCGEAPDAVDRQLTAAGYERMRIRNDTTNIFFIPRSG
jgi:FkbM family methyltransferase